MRLTTLFLSALLAWHPQPAQAKPVEPVEAEASMSPPLEDHARALRETLRAAGLVPGPAAALIPEDFAPSTVLNASFGGKAVKLGNLFRVSEVAEAPTLGFDAEVRNKRMHLHLFFLFTFSFSLFFLFFFFFFCRGDGERDMYLHKPYGVFALLKQ